MYETQQKCFLGNIFEEAGILELKMIMKELMHFVILQCFVLIHMMIRKEIL